MNQTEEVQKLIHKNSIGAQKSNIQKNHEVLPLHQLVERVSKLQSDKLDDRKRQKPKLPIKDLIKREEAKRMSQPESQKKQKFQCQKQAQKPKNKSKDKKSHHKCLLCRQKGKKSQMIKCYICRHYTHDECAQDVKQKVRYVCYKCNPANNYQQNKTDKKIQKKLQKQQTQKKLGKIKKKEQAKCALQKFKQKYPYYINQQEKIKFPIEDKLLYIYNQYFDFPQLKIHGNKHPVIQSKYLGDLMQIQNFIMSYQDQLQDDYHQDSRKVFLYQTMNCNGTDSVFERLLSGITKIYLKDVFEKNKTQNVKSMNENSFFILLGYVIQNGHLTSDLIITINQQIMRNLSTVPSMKSCFQNFQLFVKLNFQVKLQKIICLIKGLAEIDSFHDFVAKKSQKISQITKQKNDLIAKIKKSQAQVLSNRQKLKQINMAENKSKYQRLLKQLKQSNKNNQQQINQQIIKQMKQKIVIITKQIPFVISQTISLGKDRNDSCYYFFLREPYRIYVNYKNYLMDENQSFLIIQTKQKIIDFLKSLNTKGIHQKRLHDTIYSLMKEGIIRNLKSQQQQALVTKTNDQNLQINSELHYVQSDTLFKQRIISIIMQIQQNFYNYLKMKNYRWTSESKRQQFRFGFPYIESVEALKQQIKIMHQSFLFVEIVSSKQSSKQNESSSNQVSAKMQIQHIQKQTNIKRKPIRLWGINSQKIRIYWSDYLDNCVNFVGIWLCVYVLKGCSQRYIQKKNQITQELQRKQAARKLRSLKRKQKQQKKEREKQQKNMKKVLQFVQPIRIKRSLRKNGKIISMQRQQQSQQQVAQKRNLRSKNRPSKKMAQSEQEDQEYKAQSQSE